MIDVRAEAVGGSFRDPSGFVFTRDGVVYRQVNRVYAATLDEFMSSGLYDELVTTGLIVSHERTDDVPAPRPEVCDRIIRPQLVPFISYPYEWCFSQLKDAALVTLEIQKRALEHGFVLKDSSAYNVQFLGGRPVFIDTLSFDRYSEGEPWVAYRQFCQHFVAPLALMAYRDVRLASLMRSFIDGVPLDLCAELLPWRTRLSFGLLTHIHAHARSQKRYASRTSVKKRAVSRLALRGLIDNLQGTVRRLRWNPAGTEWGEYYDDTNYSDSAMESKRAAVSRLIERVSPATVWDLGANTGLFSRLASSQGALTVAFDVDAAAVEKNYRAVRASGDTHMLPIVMDLTNPSPAIGWDHSERDSLAGRGDVDLAMGLALVHHLAISNNVPMAQIARFFARVARHALIEFVPKTDSQVRRLLATRKDIFPEYTEKGFEESFAEHFDVVEKVAVEGSDRTLYLLRRRAA
ncbi:MAG: SAM-dependent methyltransferase [Candidatus Krumholzibacteriota bacterium]|nr:SAM-dependent methyltransferase [Candidatus Krumholzibacteriota bacterium]